MSSLMIAIIAMVVLGLLVALFAISIYNHLIALRNRFKNAYAQIDVQLKRRYDLIPNLVETAKGYLKHERGTLEAVIVFFGRLIQAALNRQREFLADASAVQFTRNPAGLSGALQKIGTAGSRIEFPHAGEVSHMFFENGLSKPFLRALATHPPLDVRIRAIDPDWDGKFKRESPPKVEADVPRRAAKPSRFPF